MHQIGTLKVEPKGEREIKMTRVLDAPRDVVFDAYTKPELIRRWLYGTGWTVSVCDVDLRAGGKYRIVWRKESDGSEMGMGGVYREVVRPERLVNTEKFDEPWYPGEALLTTVLSKLDGKTTLEITMRYESPEARDAVLDSDMESGIAESYDRLERLVTAGKAR
jgi:uncharacterized protein YndB with AHSA1/START domain